MPLSDPAVTPPVTLEQFLAAGYRYQMRSSAASDPAPQCAKTISRADLLAAQKALEPIKGRDHIARTRLAFIARVLALQEG